MNYQLYAIRLLIILGISFGAHINKAFSQCTLPAPTASGATINCGQSTLLNASGSGSVFRWYDQPTGGNLVHTGASFNTGVLSQSTTYYVETDNISSGSQSFTYTGNYQTWVVPASVYSITVDMAGAQGGSNYYTGGNGGRVQTELAVVPGQTLYIYVGQQGIAGGNAFNGGGSNSGYSYSSGGGGASDIRINSTNYSDVAVVAGGGGGSGYCYSYCGDQGGAGGDLTGQCGYVNSSPCYNGYSGTAGSQSAGGYSPSYGGTTYGGLGYGGTGVSYGGGGGGGYYGGGGGYSGGGGGGGSSYTSPSLCTGVTHTQGYQTGNGYINISYNQVIACSPRTAVGVTVNTFTAAPTVTGVAVSCGQAAVLTATGSTGLYRWYSQPGGLVLATGGSFTTPVLYADAVYYVEAVSSYSAPACPSALIAVYVDVMTLQPPIVNPAIQTVSCGSTATIIASGSSGYFNWYDQPTGGTLLSMSDTFTTSQLLNDTTHFYVEAVSNVNPSSTFTFNYTGSEQTWTVPAGVTSINVDVKGAQGGTNSNGTLGGNGGRVQATLSVTPGQVLHLFVGQQPNNSTGGYNGGGTGYGTYGMGGGGGSDIRIGAATLNDRIVAAGAGGGAGYSAGGQQERGGAGGGSGVAEYGYYYNGYSANYSGSGATPTAGGAGPSFCGCGSGSFGQGGTSYQGKGYSGGGGGGWYGGGGAHLGGAGGGSSYADPAISSNVVHTQGYNTGNGQIIISYEQSVCNSPRVPVTVISTPISVPSVTSAMVNCGTSAVLTASGSTGMFFWYDQPVGGNILNNTDSFYFSNVYDSAVYYVAATSDTSIGQTMTFNYTGGVQTWTVPAGVTSVNMDISGAQGGSYGTTTLGGKGGRVQATMSVTPGQVLNIYVGGTATNYLGGWNGGGQVTGNANPYTWGGGGASDIRVGGTSLNDRIIVAGGGGGAGYYSGGNNEYGGAGGGLTGGNGGYYSNSSGIGYGGSQTSGGSSNYQSGSLGQGGTGYYYGSPSGGGGGGGYYGGGGGYSGCCYYAGGGGGGSSYTIPAATSVVHTQGYKTGNGEVIISYSIPYCTSERVPVQLNPIPLTSPVATGDTVACGDAINLSASGSNGNFAWYTQPAGGTPVAYGPTVALPPVYQPDTFFVEAYNQIVNSGSLTFNYTGTQQTFTVPAGVTSINVDVLGAQGGSYGTTTLGGKGGRVQATMSVTPGQVLNIYVGGTTTNYMGGWNGGGQVTSNASPYTWGGGGASDIRVGGTSLNDRVIVAGGGGGAGYYSGGNNEYGGAGGGLTGGNGGYYSSSSGIGYGGSQTSGGSSNYQSGSLGQGGTGYYYGSPSGGGGGGGYYGGGGGYSGCCYYAGGGGGGSSYTNPSLTSNVLHTQGSNTGNGSVIISYAIVNSCQSLRVPVVIVMDSLPAPTVTGDTTFCGSGSQLFVSNNNQGSMYRWRDVNGNLLSTNSSYTTNTVSTTTQFYYNYILNNCPSEVAVGTITINPIPDPTILGNPGPLCASSNTVVLEAADTGGVWSGNGIVNSTTGEFSASSASIGANAIVYTANWNNCIASDTINIQVLASPNATITTASTNVCVDASPFNLTSASTGGTWSGTGITNTATGAFNPSLAGVGMHVVSYSVSNGICSDIDTALVTVNALPVIGITPNTPQNGCNEAGILLTGTGASTYQWYQGTSPIPGATASSYTATAQGSYYVVGTSAQGCQSSSTAVPLNINVSPVVDSLFFSDVCWPAPSSFMVNASIPAANGATISSYMWNFGDFTTSSFTTGTHNYPYPGTYTYTLTIMSSQGCSTIVSGVAEAYHIPDADFIINNSCSDQASSFIDVSDPHGSVINSWSWNFGDGTGTSILQNPSYIYDNPGNYPVTLVVTSTEGCSDSYTQSVQITPAPNATWTIAEVTGTTVSFHTDNPDPSASYEWTFGDGGTSGAMNATHTYSEPGVYEVCLTVIRNGCSATFCDSITVTNLGLNGNSDEIGLVISPNPFVSDLNVVFTLTEESNVEMVLYNVAGQVIKQTAPVSLDPGKHSVQYTLPADLSAGIYTFELRINDHSFVKKLIKIQTY